MYACMAVQVPGMIEFIGEFLVPAVKAKHPDLKIMAYDHNKVGRHR